MASAHRVRRGDRSVDGDPHALPSRPTVRWSSWSSKAGHREDALPRFSLWRLRGIAVHRVMSLDGRALPRRLRARRRTVVERAGPCDRDVADPARHAGRTADGRVWSGRRRPHGHGDPDRTGHAAPAPRVRPNERIGSHRPRRSDGGGAVDRRLPVTGAADVVAQQVTQTYDGSVPVDVVQGGKGSTIVRPARWAVLVRARRDHRRQRRARRVAAGASRTTRTTCGWSFRERARPRARFDGQRSPSPSPSASTACGSGPTSASRRMRRSPLNRPRLRRWASPQGCGSRCSTPRPTRPAQRPPEGRARASSATCSRAPSWFRPGRAWKGFPPI